MAIPFDRDINLKQNELQNAVIQNLSSDPTSGSKEGRIWMNTSTHTPMYFNGTENLEFGRTYTNGAGISINGSVISANLSVSDIPALPLDKISDVTATAAEVNILDGVIVTTSDINSITSKIELTDLSIDSSSTDYLTYDNTTGEFGANVDTTVTANSTNLVTSGAVESAISSAMIGGMIYKGVWTATGQTDYSSIALPVKAGYMYLVQGSATIGGIEWNTDDYLVINADVPVGGTITDVKKIDNTEGSDIVRLNASQTLTNKTIDADDNTISDLETDNFKSGVVRTSVDGIRDVTNASDTSIVTEKAIATTLAARVIATTNPTLTQTSGVVTWTVTNTLSTTSLLVQVFEVSSNIQVMTEVAVTASTITITMNSASNIAAGVYRIVAIG